MRPAANAPPLVPIKCASEHFAFTALALAHRYNLKTMYHPHGGRGPKFYVPITHTLWVIGDERDIRAFRCALVKTSERNHVQTKNRPTKKAFLQSRKTHLVMALDGTVFQGTPKARLQPRTG